jgi:hypothetical protein
MLHGYGEDVSSWTALLAERVPGLFQFLFQIYYELIDLSHSAIAAVTNWTLSHGRIAVKSGPLGGVIASSMVRLG